MRKAIRRGALFYADLDPVVGSEQGGTRPILILQNDVGNHFSPTVVAAAITSRKAKTHLPTHVFVGGCAGACPYLPAAVGTTADNRPEAAPWLHWASVKKMLECRCSPGQSAPA